MIPLGLSAAQQKEFHRQLRRTSRIRVRVSLTNLEGDNLVNLTPRLVEGQVNLDSTADVSRQLTLTLDDPENQLKLDSDAPSDGAIFADRMIRATYGVYVDALSRWVDVPLFLGPVMSLERTGGSIALSCHGKEALALGHAWQLRTYPKGTNTVNTIKSILRTMAGENRFSFGTSSHRLPKAVNVTRESQPWLVAQQLAKSMGRQLYYDGAGTCRLRTAPRTSLITFDEALVLSEPQLSYDMSEVKNLVRVRGYKPKGKKRIYNYKTAPRSHPLSPWKLGRNGVPRYYVETLERDNVRSNKAAGKLAGDVLASRLREVLSASFDSLPVPHLDPLDYVRLRTDEASLTFILRQASISLSHAGVMSVGTTKRVTPNTRRVRG